MKQVVNPANIIDYVDLIFKKVSVLQSIVDIELEPKNCFVTNWNDMKTMEKIIFTMITYRYVKIVLQQYLIYKSNL